MKLGALRIATLFAVGMAGASAPVQADLQAYLRALPVYQVSTDAFITFGTVVEARTNMNALWASGNYRIDCDDPHIRPALTGSRGWSDNGFKGPRAITVTVPAVVPSVQALPGWLGVMGGTFVNCTYTHSGAAKNNVLPIGSGGTTVQIGGDNWEESETIFFAAMKPGTSFGGGCIM
jgi:hypothetical protein